MIMIRININEAQPVQTEDIKKRDDAMISRVNASIGAAKRVSSCELLGRATYLVIEHEGREYRLQRTRNGKLILTA